MSTLLGIAYTEAALRGLAKVEPKKVRQQLRNRIDALPVEPKPPGSAKVQGVVDGTFEVYRIRQGDYRAIYSIRDSEIVVLAIGHRKDIYRD